MANPLPVFSWGTTYPTATSEYHQAGEFIFNSAISAVNTAFGWTCIASGNPGTWTIITTVPSSTITTYTAQATLAAGLRMARLTAENTFTLPSPASYPAGVELVVQNASGGSITLAAPSNKTLVGLATSTTATSIRLMSDGSNYWYRSN